MFQNLEDYLGKSVEIVMQDGEIITGIADGICFDDYVEELGDYCDVLTVDTGSYLTDAPELLIKEIKTL